MKVSTRGGCLLVCHPVVWGLAPDNMRWARPRPVPRFVAIAMVLAALAGSARAGADDAVPAPPRRGVELELGLGPSFWHGEHGEHPSRGLAFRGALSIPVYGRWSLGVSATHASWNDSFGSSATSLQVGADYQLVLGRYWIRLRAGAGTERRHGDGAYSHDGFLAVGMAAGVLLGPRFLVAIDVGHTRGGWIEDAYSHTNVLLLANLRISGS